MAPEPLTSQVGIAYLTFVPEGSDVMVGRPDTGEYAVFPPEGAEAVRRLRSGQTPGEVAAWFESHTGTPLDIEDLINTLSDLGFIAGTDAETAAPAPVRGRRLGQLAFSAPAWVFYALSVAAAVVLMVADPGLRPSYRHVFFTTHLSLLPVAIASAQPPLMILHEAYHALAGRRLGLPSQLRIGRRLYFIVAETRLNALYSVPKRSRYLPLLAGIVIDVCVLSWLTIAAAVVTGLGGPGWLAGYLLALAVTVVVRLLWQTFFFLESDLYFILCTAFGCTNLQAAARLRLYRAYRRLLGRPAPEFGEEWDPRDVAASRWYAPLLFVGLLSAGANLALFVIPSVVRLLSILGSRLADPATIGAAQLLDTTVFLLLAIGQVVLVGYLVVRDRRRLALTSRSPQPDSEPLP